VVLEYATEQLVEEVARDLAEGDGRLLRPQPLLKARAKEYVRRSQEHLIAEPLLERLAAVLGSRRAAEGRLIELLERLRQEPLERHGYGAGNVANLLRLLRGELGRLDFSDLRVRQAYLVGVEAQDASLAGAQLEEAALPVAFQYPSSVALSPDGTHLLAGTATGELWLWRVADRSLLLTMPAHRAVVIRVDLAVEQGLVASASHDGTVKLWDLPRRQLRATLVGH
jgi:hypothetical protein